MEKLIVNFNHKGIEYNLWITPLSKEDLPTVFHVYDYRNYFHGQLIFYPRENVWRFHNNPDIAEILGERVVLWYQ